MQSTILFLQHELKTAKDIIATFETDMQALRQSHKSDATAAAADVDQCLGNGAEGDATQTQHQQQQQQRTNGQWNGVNVALCSAVKTNEVTSAVDDLRNNGEVNDDGGQSRLRDERNDDTTAAANGSSNAGAVPTANGKRSLDDDDDNDAATSANDDPSASKKVRRSSDVQPADANAETSQVAERTLNVGDNQSAMCNNGIAVGPTEDVGESVNQ